MIDEVFLEDEAGIGLGPVSTSDLDVKTAALVQLAAAVAVGSSSACLERSAGRALTAGATQDQVADVLLAIAPVAGLGGVVSAAPDVASAAGHDAAAAGTSRADGVESRAAEQAHGDRELLDQVVRSLFRVGLSLQAAIDIPGAAVLQITSAQQRLEETIRTIRDHVFTGSERQVHR